MKLPLQDTERVKSGLRDAITLLCKTGLTFQTELNISGLLGITLDHNEVFLVDIKEVIKNSTESLSSKDDRRRRKSSTVTRLRNVDVEEDDSDSEAEIQYAKRSRLDTKEEINRYSADSNGPESVPQRFIRNTDIWFPESESNNEKLSQGAIVVEPTGDFEETEQSRPSSKNSIQSGPLADNGPVQGENNQPAVNSIQANDTQQEIDLSNPNELNCSDNNQQNKGKKISSTLNKTLEQAINKLNRKQHINVNDIQANDNQDYDKPINLSSRSTSRIENKYDQPAVKEEPHDLENQVFPPVLPLFSCETIIKPPPGLQTAPPFTEPELHARWLQNIAAHVQTVVHPPQLLCQSNIPVTLPNTQVRGYRWFSRAQNSQNLLRAN